MKATIQSSRYAYSRDDYYFRRTSRTQGDWGRRIKPLRSRFSPTRIVDLLLNVTQLKVKRG